MRQRLITGGLMALLFIVLLMMGGYAYLTIILLMAVFGFSEFVRMNGGQWKEMTTMIGYAAIVFVVMPVQQWLTGWSIHSFERFLWLFLIVLLAVTVISKNRLHIGKVFPIFLGVFYIGIGFKYMLAVRWEWELYWSLFIFGCIWLTDTGAYLTGRWFGRTKLWPSISPKKTVEGAVGGLVFAVVAALLFYLYDPTKLPLAQSLMLAIVISVLGQVGDLIQSAYKRNAGVKDSGRMLPGHGGVLDRCDSWLTVFPFLYFLIPPT